MGNPRQIAEGVARVVRQLRVIGRAHQADGNGMAELADVADHVVVLGGGQHADALEAQLRGQVAAPVDARLAVLFRRGDDEVCGGKVDLGAVGDAARLAARIGWLAINSTPSGRAACTGSTTPRLTPDTSVTIVPGRMSGPYRLTQSSSTVG